MDFDISLETPSGSEIDDSQKDPVYVPESSSESPSESQSQSVIPAETEYTAGKKGENLGNAEHSEDVVRPEDDSDADDEGSRVQRYGNDPCDQFILDHENKNTRKKTKSDMKTLMDFLRIKWKLHDAIEELNPEKLNDILCDYFINVRKADGTEYEPSSLRGMFSSIVRYLQSKEYCKNLRTSDEFSKTREALSKKQKNLKQQGKGRGENRTRPLTEEEIDRAFAAGAFGLNNPKALLYLVYWNNVNHFGMRPGLESREMRLGDVVLREDPATGKEYVTYGERATKTRNGDNPRNIRKTLPTMWSTTGLETDARDPITAYKLYIEKRPENMTDIDSPFYLSYKRAFEPSSVWYTSVPLGKNTLGAIIKDVANISGISGGGRKISNHSARKTMVKSLKRKKVPDTDIKEISWHRNIQSITDYNELELDEAREYSHILSAYTSTVQQTEVALSSRKSVSEPLPKKPDLTGNSGSFQLSSIFRHSSITGGNFYINLGSGSKSANPEQ